MTTLRNPKTNPKCTPGRAVREEVGFTGPLALMNGGYVEANVAVTGLCTACEGWSDYMEAEGVSMCQRTGTDGGRNDRKTVDGQTRWVGVFDPAIMLPLGLNQVDITTMVGASNDGHMEQKPGRRPRVFGVVGLDGADDVRWMKYELKFESMEGDFRECGTPLSFPKLHAWCALLEEEAYGGRFSIAPIRTLRDAQCQPAMVENHHDTMVARRSEGHGKASRFGGGAVWVENDHQRLSWMLDRSQHMEVRYGEQEI